MYIHFISPGARISNYTYTTWWQCFMKTDSIRITVHKFIRDRSKSEPLSNACFKMSLLVSLTPDLNKSHQNNRSPQSGIRLKHWEMIDGYVIITVGALVISAPVGKVRVLISLSGKCCACHELEMDLACLTKTGWKQIILYQYQNNTETINKKKLIPRLRRFQKKNRLVFMMLRRWS